MATPQWRANNRERVREIDRKFYRKNRKKRIQEANKWAKDNPEKFALYQRKSALSKKGWTLEEYRQAEKEQQGLCAICGKPNLQSNVPLHADHDHITKNKRQLLCGFCNTGLGLFQDKPELLDKAAQYLRKHSEEKC